MAATRGARSPSVQQAFVLHHYDWSETSLVLDLFTREQGRLAVVAKGAKRPYSQLRAVLLPFQRIQVGLSRPAKGEAAAEVSTLRSAEWVGGHTLPAGAALFSAYYLNELLLKFLARQDPHPALFETYAQTLARLDEPALRAFELRLLAEVGLLPDLSLSGTRQTPLELERLYAISPETGVLAAEAENPAALRGASLVQLQAALLHGSSAALHQACEGAPAQALRAALRGLLQYHLGHKPLRTRQVLLDVQRLME